MKSYKSLLFLSLVPALALSSCYHEFTGGGGGGGGNGNAFINVLVTSTPSTTFSFPSLNWQIGEIDIVNSAGTLVPIASGGLPVPDFARLQTDSLYLGHVTLGATSYTSLKVQLNTPAFPTWIYNSSNSTMFNTCLPSTVCLIPSTVPGYGATTVIVPITYTAIANSSGGLRVNFDLSKAVTTAGASGITFDFTQTGAITLIPLPPTSSQTAGIDTVDNFTGTVISTAGTNVTVGSAVSEQRTFTMATTVEFDDPQNICPPPASFSCFATAQNVSMDGYINAADGSFVATEVEFIDPAPSTVEVEGVIITPVINNQFKIALTNSMGLLGTLSGESITVVLTGAENYLADPKNLGVSTTPVGFLSASDLVMGQTVMLKGGTLSPNGNLTNSTRVLLRYSSIGGGVATPSGTIFTLMSPSFTTLFNGGSFSVQTFPNTAYDNINGFSGLSNITNASVRGLYLNPNSGATQSLLAAKVRSH
jgi:hypothetical protein